MASTYLRAHQASNAVGKALSPYNNQLEVRAEETKNHHFIHITPKTRPTKTPLGKWDWHFRSQLQEPRKIHALQYSEFQLKLTPNTPPQVIQQQSEGDQLVTVTIEESELENN